MMRRIGTATALLAAFPLANALAQSDAGEELILHGWNISGETRLSGDYFVTTGNAANSAFPFDGAHGVVSTNADFTRPLEGDRTINGSIGLSVDGSDYFQASDNFFTLESLDLEYTNGDASTPYRLELGDFFGFYSRRTLQRGLKGAQIELQPDSLQNKDTAGSLQFSAGNTAPTYNLIGENNANFFGGSFVLNNRTYGAMAVSLVHGSQAPFDGSGAALNQWVGSVAASKNLDLESQTITLDGELAYLAGDVNNGAVTRNERSLGANFSLNGNQKNGGLSYGLRFDRFLDGFVPLGGQATADRFSAEGDIGYRFEDGYNLRLSGSEIGEQLTGNKTFRRSLRSSLSGPFLTRYVKGWNSSADIFRTHTRNQNKSTNTAVWTGIANLSGPVIEGYTGSLGLFATHNNDRLANANDTFSYQVTTSLSHRRTIGDYRLNGTAGLAYRRTDSQADQTEIGPTLSLEVTKDNHALRVAYSRLDSRNDGNGAVDLVTDNLNVNYSWTAGRHRFEARGGYFARTPQNQEQTDTVFLGFTYNLRFGQPARRTAFVPPPAPSLSDSLKLSSLPPGVPARTADLILPALGVTARLGDNPQIIEPINVYPVSGRQRFVVEQRSGLVTRTGVIIETVGLRADELDRELDRLEDLLTSRYGAPQRRLREGDADGFFGANTDLPIRLTDWRLPTGGTIRMGIPPRFGVQPRIEVVASQSLPADEREDWGFKDIN